MTEPQGAVPRRLIGRRAIVTGAGSGIGRAIAHRLGAEGARVVVADIDTGAAEAVAGELGPPAVSHTVDVTREESVAAMVKRVREEWDGLDVLVNNAGIGIAATTPDCRHTLGAANYERLRGSGESPGGNGGASAPRSPRDTRGDRSHGCLPGLR